MKTIPERAGSVLGVPGRFHNAHSWPGNAALWSTQTWVSERRKCSKAGDTLQVEMRFDDNCKNGHNSFAITGDIRSAIGRWEAGGCLHDDIARVFPELIPLIKWHLTSDDGPMHYIANTIYHAGDRDSSGLRAGEVRQIRDGKTGAPCWIREGVSTAYAHGEDMPTETVTLAWKPWNRVGEGKPRQLDHARSSAVWPEATDAELCAEPAILRAALEARAPALIASFLAAMQEAGFTLAPGAN